MEESWICVRLDSVGLWTADLCCGDNIVKNLGGSYPKSSSAILDAKKTWGYLKTRVMPTGIHVEYEGEVDGG